MIKFLLTASLALSSCFSVGAYGELRSPNSVSTANDPPESQTTNPMTEDKFALNAMKIASQSSISFESNQLEEKTRALYRAFRKILDAPEGLQNDSYIKYITHDFTHALGEWSAEVAMNARGFTLSTRLEHHRIFTQTVLREMLDPSRFLSPAMAQQFFDNLHNDMNRMYEKTSADYEKTKEKFLSTIARRAIVMDMWASGLLALWVGADIALKHYPGSKTGLVIGAIAGAAAGAHFFFVLRTLHPRIARRTKLRQESLIDLASRLKIEVQNMNFSDEDCNGELMTVPEHPQRSPVHS